jgi:transposase
MLIVETIRKIRLRIHRDGQSIRKTAKELGVSRNTVRKVVRSQQAVSQYRRIVQPRPVLGAFADQLQKGLAEDQKLLKRLRRSAVVLFEQLQREGYAGGYDSVRRFVQDWRRRQSQLPAEVLFRWCLPLGRRFSLIGATSG